MSSELFYTFHGFLMCLDCKGASGHVLNIFLDFSGEDLEPKMKVGTALICPFKLFCTVELMGQSYEKRDFQPPFFSTFVPAWASDQ